MSEREAGRRAGNHREGSVLIVSAEAKLRGILSDFLGGRGLGVIEAANGLEALLQVKRARPRAVVLDVTMPRLGGLDALRRIRAFNPSVTAVIVTEVLDDDLMRRAQALGAADVLAKPIALANLWRTLGGMMSDRPAAAAAPISEREAELTSADASPARVVVVDDDPAVLEMLTEFLTRKGYEVRIAMDGVGGLSAVLEDPPDVVLLDIEMPGFNGVAALQHIRSMGGNSKVIMVSGSTDESVSKRALAQGAFDYVTKPINFQHLTQTLETAVMMERLERDATPTSRPRS